MSLRKFNNYDLEGFARVLSWNPLAMRCTPVNEGCRNCWHLKMADRLAKNPVIPRGMRLAYEGNISPLLSAGMFERLPNGRIIAVQFMGDLWHENVDRSIRLSILNMAAGTESIFLLLTKRPENVTELIPHNCWMGVSAHDGPSLENAMEGLRKIDARHKWISLEPMLGGVKISSVCSGLDFIAFGPEMVNGVKMVNSVEPSPSFQYWFYRNWHGALRDIGLAMYDKSIDYETREWPEEWKRVCKRVKGGV